MSDKWTEKDIPDLSGMVIVITGANSGLGYENSLQFAEKNAIVVMACRNLEKGELAVEKIMKKVPHAKLDLMKLDLGNLDSISKFVAEFKNKYDRLDILLNNAGIMMVPYGKTVDGFERQNGINHLGHFALTAQLFDLLKKTGGSRIVNVSSVAHKRGTMDFDDYLFEKEYDRSVSYGRSKLSNLLFTYELDRRLKKSGINMYALASHPGVALTNLANHMLGPLNYVSFLLKPVMNIILHSAKKGSLPSARAAIDPSVKGGEYFGPHKERKGDPIVVSSNEASYNEEDAAKLWQLSEELTGVKFAI